MKEITTALIVIYSLFIATSSFAGNCGSRYNLPVAYGDDMFIDLETVEEMGGSGGSGLIWTGDDTSWRDNGKVLLGEYNGKKGVWAKGAALSARWNLKNGHKWLKIERPFPNRSGCKQIYDVGKVLESDGWDPDGTGPAFAGVGYTYVYK